MFYTFRQNNSYGRWVIDEKRGISINVIVEANTIREANERAEEIGLYFDGYMDCPCCGNRWNRASEYEDPTPVPTVYDIEIKPDALYPDVYHRWLKDGIPEVFVHPLKGPFFSAFSKSTVATVKESNGSKKTK